MALRYPILAAALLAVTPVHARTLTDAEGRASNYGYAIECRSGDYLTGLKVRGDGAVAAIGIICSTWTGGTLRELDTRDHFAGNGDGPRTAVRCQGAAAIESLEVQTARNGLVGFVRPTCINLAPPFGHQDLALLGAQDTSLRQRTLQCPPGQVATGLHGRMDGQVTSVGLVCSPRPQGDALRRSPATMRESGAGAAPVAPLSPPPAATGTARPNAQQVIDALLTSPCRPGFVPRKAKTSDAVCVTTQSRALVREENRTWLDRVDRGGPNGLASCIPGHVWRGAFEGDVVCVPPARAAEVAEENRLAASRASE